VLRALGQTCQDQHGRIASPTQDVVAKPPRL
jgi:hypothetical protein